MSANLKTYKRRIYVYAITVIVSVTIYLYLAPVYIGGISVIRARRLNLEMARNYYTVLSSWLTLLVGFAGLRLGYFYYKDKHRLETEASSRERRRRKLDKLIELIDQYDEFVNQVIIGKFDNALELTALRVKIRCSFDQIEIMCELSEDLLGIDINDVAIILRVNSYIDKEQAVMEQSFEELVKDNSKLLAVRDNYLNLIQEARRACYKKIC